MTKNIILGFSSPKKFKIGAELIKLWQGRTDYSHVFIVEERSFVDRVLIYQASHGKVHCISKENFLKENNIIATFELSTSIDTYKNCVKYCIDNLQKEYGYLGLIKIILNKKFKVSGDGAGSFHCSELAARAVPVLKQCIDIDPDFIEPVQLKQALDKMLKLGMCKSTYI